MTTLVILLLFLFQGGKEKAPKVVDSMVNGKRILYFSGYYWEVLSSSDMKQAPGPNYFSDSKENVWLDENGRLHLRITHRNNRWYCAQVSQTESAGHGRYLFYADSRIDLFDKNVVGGLFNYQSDSEEIDIEFSGWGKDGEANAHYSVQPSTLTGNSIGFNINLTNPLTTHWFNWQSNRIDFASFTGHSPVLPEAGRILQQWSYSGPNIPPDSNEVMRINLWLFMGWPPSDLQEAELIVSGVSVLK